MRAIGEALIEPDPYDLWLQFKRLWEERQGVVSSEYRAAAIRHGKSGLAEDVFVNTLYFLADDNKVTAADDINAAILDFYNTPGPTHPLNAYMSTFVDQVLTVKVYKMSDAAPKEPLIREQTLTTTRLVTEGFPEEVAVCLSYSAASPHTDRRRGRIYLGPLTSACFAANAGTSQCIVNSTFQGDIAAAAVRLANHVDAGWLIYSKIGVGSYAAVETGWIDNAVDIQRRRGPKAISRLTWAKS